MTEKESLEMELEKLQEARAYLIAGKQAEALGCYAVVATVNPENPEAKFFIHYIDYVDFVNDQNAENSKLKLISLRLINSLEHAVKYVSEADCSKKEKLGVISQIVDDYTSIPGFVIGMRISPIEETIQSGVLSLYWLGSYIKNDFNEDPEAMKLAIIPWKEAVKQQQKWYAYKYEGYKAEDYAAQIQKVDPAYTMPKKAGCVSLG